MTYAVIFPGQGAAAPTSGEAWRDHPAWATVEQAEDLLERPLAHLLLKADAEELGTTRASQLAVLVTSLLAWDTFIAELEEPPVALAGHSLGQITALLASGAVERDDGLRLAARRADLTQQSAEANPGRMVALMGCDYGTAATICSGVDAWVANDNAPGQIVIAGTTAGVDQASQKAKASGVRRVISLAVGHAFHTPLLADAAAELRPLLNSLSFAATDTPVVANTDAQVVGDPASWPDQLARHLVETVRWQDCQRTLTALGADTLVELGPGRVLAGLARRTVPEVRVLNAATPDEVSQVVEALRTERTLAATPSSSPSPPEAKV